MDSMNYTNTQMFGKKSKIERSQRTSAMIEEHILFSHKLLREGSNSTCPSMLFVRGNKAIFVLSRKENTNFKLLSEASTEGG